MPASIDAHGSGRQRTGRRPGGDRPGVWASTASFPPRPGNVARSRALTRTALAAWGVTGADEGRLADSAEIVVSELVTNAVRHGRGAVSLALVLTAEALQISVSDSGPAMPAPRRARADEQGGRGLQIVAALCESWRVTTRLRGKTVTCRLARDRPATGPTGPRTPDRAP